MARAYDRRPYPVARPFLLVFARTGLTIPITSWEAERLISNYPAGRRATAYRVTLVADGGGLVTITPATVGGGPAFTF